jgi:sugar lactone lactonase YvrE
VTVRQLLLRNLAAATVLVAAAFASAHGGSGLIDIDAIDERVDAQLDATTGKTHKAYAALARVIRKANTSRRLGVDVGKLLATARACHKTPLSADGVLHDALAAPETEADTVLAASPDALVIASRRLERAADRARVLARSGAAESLYAAGVARRNANDEVGMLAQFRRAADGFDKAGALASTLLRRQIRRGAPGQPLAKGPKGTIDTFAGTGLTTQTADGTRARDFSFYFPMDVAVDPGTGLVHIVDYNNHKIRFIDAAGKVRTLVKSTLFPVAGPGLEASLDHPASVAFDPLSGDMLIAGWHGGSIVRVTPARTSAGLVGGGEAGDIGDGGPVANALFKFPSGIAFDSQGGWYVADQFNQRVRYVDPAGTIHAFAGTGVAGFAGDSGPALDAQLNSPADAAGSPAGRVALSPDEHTLYIADTANHRVRMVDLTDPSRPITTLAGNGNAGTSGDGSLAINAALDEPVDVDCDAAGNVFICDSGQSAHVIRRVDAVTRNITTIAGTPGVTNVGPNIGNGAPATQAYMNRPSGIFVDRTRGRLYVADTGHHMIRVVWE